MVEPLVTGYSFLIAIMSSLPGSIQAFYRLVLGLVAISSVLKVSWTLRG